MSAPCQILIVDNDRNLCLTLSDILLLKGFAPVVVPNGEKALETLNTGDVSVVLIDLRLEDMGGIELLSQIKQFDPEIECIVLTGYSSQASAIEALNMGAYSYLQKPFDFDQLLVTIHRAIERRQSAKALRESEARYRTIFDGVRDAIFVETPEGVILDVNQAACKMFGYSHEEFVTKTVADIVPDYALVLSVKEDGSSFLPDQPVETVNIRANGEHFPVEVSGSLQRIGDQPVMVIVVRDITERKRTETEIKRNAQESTALFDTVGDLAAWQDLSSLLHTIVTRAKDLLETSEGAIYLYNPDSNVLEATILTDSALPRRNLRLGEGLAGKVAKEIRPLWVDDYRTWDGKSTQYEDMPISAVLDVPMLHAGELVGVLVVHEMGDTSRKFSEQDARLLSMFAGQAASAVYNARLLEATRLQAVEMTSLFEISSRQVEELQILQKVAIAGIQAISLDDLVEGVTQTISSALYPDNWGVMLFDEQSGQLRSHSSYRGIVDDSPLNYDMTSVGIVGHVFSTGLPYRSGDVSQDPHYIKISNPTRSELCVPISVGERVIGVINTESNQENFYDEKDEQLLVTIAGQLATAIESLRLYAETRRRLEELEMLYDNSLALIGLFDANAIGKQVISLLGHRLSWHHATIRLYSPESNSLSLLAFHVPGVEEKAELNAIEQRFNELVSKPGEGLSGWVVEHGELVNCADVTKDSRYADTYPGIRSGLYIPLKTGSRVIGVMSVESDVESAFHVQDERLMTTLANQVAAALENAHLLMETRQRLAELEAVNHISISLRAASSLEDMLPIFVDETLRALNTSAGWLATYDAQQERFSFGVARGWFEAFSESPPSVDEGFSALVLESGKPYFSDDFSTDTNIRKAALAFIPPGWGGGCIPVFAGQELVGLFYISVALPRRITSSEINLLSTLSEMIGSAIHRARLHEETERQVQRLAALRVIDNTINSILDLELTLELLVSQIHSQLNIDAVDIRVFNPLLQELKFTAGIGFRTLQASHPRLKLGEGLAGQVGKQWKRMIVPEITGDEQPSLPFGKDEGFKSFVGVPLISKAQLRGVLEIWHRSPLEVDDEWLAFLDTVAGQVAISIENSMLFENLQLSNLELSLAYDATIEGWSRALDLRDHETEGHTQRVTAVTLELAKAMGVEPIKIPHMRRGSLLHDIGKLGVPDGILHKPGPLSEEEWRIMRRHPSLAFEMLSPIDYLQESLEIPFCHHEKWDGSGYPRRLAGEAIPLSARIFTLVDVFDALCSDRPYREAWSEEKTLAYIKEQTGKCFDPRVVEVFLKLIIEKPEIFD